MENNNNGRSSYFLYGLSRMTMKVNVYKQNNNNNNNNNDDNNNNDNNKRNNNSEKKMNKKKIYITARK